MFHFFKIFWPPILWEMLRFDHYTISCKLEAPARNRPLDEASTKLCQSVPFHHLKPICCVIFLCFPFILDSWSWTSIDRPQKNDLVYISKNEQLRIQWNHHVRLPRGAWICCMSSGVKIELSYCFVGICYSLSFNFRQCIKKTCVKTYFVMIFEEMFSRRFPWPTEGT